MIRKAGVFAAFAMLLILGTTRYSDVFAKPAPGSSWGRDLITQHIDEDRRVVLPGNTRPEATPANDRGSVPDDFRLEHILLQLKRAPEQEQALEEYMDGLTTHGVSNYHQWLSASATGANYNQIETWLKWHGIQVNIVYPNRMVMDISGTAAQLHEAMRLNVHFLEVNGVGHFANMNDPEIPEALAPAVEGIVSVHDFRPRTMSRARADYTESSGSYTLVPGDIAAIYNLNPLFSQGISGQGQTIAVIEDSDLYTNNDVTTFRNTFGLNAYSGSVATTHPAPLSGINNCTDPGGIAGTEFEVAVDAEWAGVAAPSANIQVATCKDSGTTFGVLLAFENLVSLTKPPSIISMSYGECEAENGAVANLAYSVVYQTAALAGVSVFVAAGDEGAASCDANQTKATHGIGVSGFASTPYNVAVGGTDFGDTYSGTASGYWNTTNSSTFESAKGYVREIPWNDSCAGVLLWSYEGYSEGYGASGFCNSKTGSNFLTTASGSGGPSNCATGIPATAGVASGTCKGYGKPSWQSGLFGNPGDNVRDLPDVSLFASNGLWGHYYVICFSNTSQKGAACTAGNPGVWTGAGGTSFGSPILAGIQALVNQRTGTNQGNPNPTYYAIAKSEYGSTGSAGCNSSTQPLPRRGVASACVFYDVTQGDIEVNCQKLGATSENCYLPSSTYGVLSTSTAAYQIAYGTTAGWDFATGIGTVNAYNLVFSSYWTQAP